MILEFFNLKALHYKNFFKKNYNKFVRNRCDDVSNLNCIYQSDLRCTKVNKNILEILILIDEGIDLRRKLNTDIKRF